MSVSRGASRKRDGAIALGVLAIALAFWLWSSRADKNHAPVTDPATLEQQAREHPEDFSAQIAWAEALVQAKRPEEAAPILEQARRLAPDDARLPALEGVVAIAQHRDSEARNLLGEALRRDPANVTALRALANLDAQQRRVHPAIQGFERLVQLRPNDADAWQRLGLLFIGARQNQRSLDALARSAALDPTDMLTQRALGNMALYAGRTDQAKAAFQAVLTKEPNDPQALIGLAGVMLRQDPSPAGLAAAEQQADTALNVSPTALAYRVRGHIRMMRKHFPEAIADLNAAIRIEPKKRETYVLLSQCYASAGKPDLARKASAQYERLTAAQLARDRALGPPEARK